MKIYEEEGLDAGCVLDVIKQLVALGRANTPSLAKMQSLDFGDFLLPLGMCSGQHGDAGGRGKR